MNSDHIISYRIVSYKFIPYIISYNFRMTLKEPKQKTIHKPIGAVIEAGKRNILYLLVFTCHYLYQLSNEISSLVRLANQINVMA